MIVLEIVKMIVTFLRIWSIIIGICFDGVSNFSQLLLSELNGDAAFLSSNFFERFWRFLINKFRKSSFWLKRLVFVDLLKSIFTINFIIDLRYPIRYLKTSLTLVRKITKHLKF
jgi:hypothetical protein